MTVDDFYASTCKLLELKSTEPNEDHFKAFQLLLRIENPNLSRMISQYIAKYACFFETLQEQVLDKEIDFCEDDNLTVRLEAIQQLVNFTTACPKFGIRVVDVLIQLLQTEVAEEEQLVVKSLLSCFKLYPKESITAILHQISNGNDNVVEVSCSFLKNHVLLISHQSLKLKLLEKLLLINQTPPTTDLIINLILITDITLDFSRSELVSAWYDALHTVIQSDLPTALIIFGKMKDLYKNGLPSGRAVLLLLEFIVGKDTTTELNYLTYIAECIPFISQKIEIDRFYLALNKTLAEIPQGNAVTLSLFKLEPILYCIYYLSVPRDLSVMETKKLSLIYKKIQLVQQDNQGNSIAAQKLRQFSKNVLLITQELLKGKYMQKGKLVNFSWTTQYIENIVGNIILPSNQVKQGKGEDSRLKNSEEKLKSINIKAESVTRQPKSTILSTRPKLSKAAKRKDKIISSDPKTNQRVSKKISITRTISFPIVPVSKSCIRQ